MQDKEMKCLCGELFFFTVSDQEFYARKGFQPPKRCDKCRVIKKAKFNDKPIQKEVEEVQQPESEDNEELEPWQRKLKAIGRNRDDDGFDEEGGY